MKTIIAGSREITSPGIVARAILASGIEITEVVSGGARGVDSLGEQWARRSRIPVTEFPVTPADWKKYGKRAGYIRNHKMGEYAEALIAVWDGQSRGTGHMINIAKELGLLVKMFIYDEKTGELRESRPEDQKKKTTSPAVSPSNSLFPMDAFTERHR